MTPLHRATEHGRPDDAELLLRYHACVDTRNRYGETPLIMASRDGELEVARVLLQHGASVHFRDAHDWTGLMVMVA
jgi:ankyrin repeat protein